MQTSSSACIVRTADVVFLGPRTGVFWVEKNDASELGCVECRAAADVVVVAAPGELWDRPWLVLVYLEPCRLLSGGL